jgi:hypothetical protein
MLEAGAALDAATYTFSFSKKPMGLDDQKRVEEEDHGFSRQTLGTTRLAAQPEHR